MNYRFRIAQAKYLDKKGSFEKADIIHVLLKKATIEDEGGFKDKGPYVDINRNIIKDINTDPFGNPYPKNPFEDMPPTHPINNTPPEGWEENDFSEHEQDDMDVFADMQKIASEYYQRQSDPLYAFASSGILMGIGQRDDAIYNLKKDRQLYSSNTPEYAEITHLMNYLETLIPFPCSIHDGTVESHIMGDYLTYCSLSISEDKDGSENFSINVQGSQLLHLQGEIKGKIKNDQLISCMCYVFPEDVKDTWIKPKLSADEILRLVEYLRTR